MPEPNWRRFARDVVWTPDVNLAIQHLGLEIPPEGRPSHFRCSSASVTRDTEAAFICWSSRAGFGRSIVVGTGAEVIDALQPMPPYGASGKALRAWLQMWGAWSPPAKAQPTEPTPPPHSFIGNKQ
jgi:hypothetical protein